MDKTNGAVNTIDAPDELTREWLIERAIAEVCCNPKGGDRIAALKLLKEIEAQKNPFDESLSLEQRTALLKQLLNEHDVIEVIRAMPVALQKIIKESI